MSSTSILAFLSVEWAISTRSSWGIARTSADAWTVCLLMAEMFYHKPRYYFFLLKTIIHLALGRRLPRCVFSPLLISHLRLECFAFRDPSPWPLIIDCLSRPISLRKQPLSLALTVKCLGKFSAGATRKVFSCLSKKLVTLSPMHMQISRPFLRILALKNLKDFGLTKKYLLQENGLVEGLTWDCSDEFDATSEQPISFLSDQSFISFPNWISRAGAMVSFKVKTSRSPLRPSP